MKVVHINREQKQELVNTKEFARTLVEKWRRRNKAKVLKDNKLFNQK